jgi:acetyl esterase/lipase
MLRFFAAIIALTLVSACGGTQLLNSVAVNPGKIERDIAYGTLPRQKLDVYSPKTMTPETPTLVFYHGGSWQYGSKDDYRFLGTAFAARGIQTVVVNYRLHPEVVFPAFVEDAAKALAFTKTTIAQGRPVFIAGHSAGAHIAAMVALDPRFLAAERTSICDASKGLIGISGPYDFTPIDPEFKLIFPAEILPSTKPINFATTPAPPTLLLHGTKDDTVMPSRTTDMAAALRAGGNNVQVKMYEGVDHLYIIGAVSPVVRRAAPTLADIVTFIGEQKAAGYPGCARAVTAN